MVAAACKFSLPVQPARQDLCSPQRSTTALNPPRPAPVRCWYPGYFAGLGSLGGSENDCFSCAICLVALRSIFFFPLVACAWLSRIVKVRADICAFIIADKMTPGSLNLIVHISWSQDTKHYVRLKCATSSLPPEILYHMLC